MKLHLLQVQDSIIVTGGKNNMKMKKKISQFKKYKFNKKLHLYNTNN